MKETPVDKRESSRQLRDTNQRRPVLDAASRKRRQKKALEALEQDNYHDDPHANLVMHKKAPKFEESLREGGTAGGSGGIGSGAENKAAAAAAAANLKRRRARIELFKQRFRKNFAALLEEEQLNCLTSEETASYFTAAAPPSKLPERKFCSVCGSPSNYTCGPCGSRYCSVKCLGTHRDTRCLKWTA